MANPRTLPELTVSYHHARHLLAFVSGLLLTWDYLGLSFGAASEGFFGLRVFIRHPDTIPNAILILGFYCALRLGVEWWQCDEDRRDTTASIVDCAVAYLLFVAAETSFVLLRFQATFSRLTIIGVVLGLGFTPLFALLFKRAQPKHKWDEGIRRPTYRLLWTILSASGVAALTVTAIGLLLGLPRWLTPGLPIGAASAGIVGAFFHKSIARKLSSGLSAA